jgi:transcriptional regulator with XRE-family HTH domain
MSDATLDSFTSFGELLRYLRPRARLTQRELGLAVGYSEGQITRLENGTRLPDLVTVKAQFIEALGLEQETRLARRLIDLASLASAAQGQGDTPLPPAPPPAAPLPRLTNLPRQLTHFIGRERDVAEVRRLLAVYPLVTLTGAGGVGKTRLAIEVGSALQGFADGVVYVKSPWPYPNKSTTPYCRLRPSTMRPPWRWAGRTTIGRPSFAYADCRFRSDISVHKEWPRVFVD